MSAFKSVVTAYMDKNMHSRLNSPLLWEMESELLYLFGIHDIHTCGIFI